MSNNVYVKLLSSIPVIIIVTYFFPLAGVLLIIMRFIICKSSKERKNLPIFLIFIGFFIKILFYLNKNFNFINLDNLKLLGDDIISSSNFFIMTGIIFLLIYLVLERLSNNTFRFVRNYISEQEKRNREISEKNDLIMKEKQYKAKNTTVVYCPYCGADNKLTEKTGVCSYCRRSIKKK